MLSSLVTKSGQTGGTTRSMFNNIFLLIYFPLTSKVAVRNILCMSDYFPLPVESLNAPRITIPGQDEADNTDIHFSWRSLPVNMLKRE